MSEAIKSVPTISLVSSDAPGQDQDMEPDNQAQNIRPIVVVTGLSGAGKNSVLKTLEDLNFEAIDNLPMPLWAQAVNLSSKSDANSGLALGLDVRSRGFDVHHLSEILTTLRAISGYAISLIYLECDDETLQRRFNETRRRHPLAPDRPLIDGIRKEREELAHLRQQSDLVIDTTNLSLPDLRHTIATQINQPGQQSLTLQFVSFAYKNGLPRSADLVFDVRFLRNPHYDPQLRPMNGQDKEIQEYISQDIDFADFIEKLQAMLDLAIQRYQAEGKSYLTIATGCSGGKHRSVFVTETLARWINSKGFSASIRHQVLDKYQKLDAPQQ